MGVTFIENGHLYINSKGVVIPSVSELVNFACGDAYEGVPRQVLSKAADHGTKVHALIEDLVNGDLDIERFHYEKRDPYIKEAVFQADKLLKKYLFKIIATEELVHYKERYAGRYDLLTKDEFIIDIKTTAKLHEERLAWQLGFYYLAIGLNREFGYCLHIPKGQPAKVHLLHVKRNKECLAMLEAYERAQYEKSITTN